MSILLPGKYLRSDKILFYGSISSVICFVISMVVIAFAYGHLPPFIPLYNQLPWGETRLGTKNEFFIFPVMMAGIVFVNIITALLVYEKVPLLSRLFAITSLLTGLFGLLFIVRTVVLIV